MTLESVHAVWDYYDGILTGVADHHGFPHYFEREWNEDEQDYRPTFRLKRLEPSTLVLVLEQWRIFREWEAAFHRGEVPQESHPAEPGANARYAELERTLRTSIAALPFLPSVAEPRFVALPGQEAGPRGVMAELQVEWPDAA